MVDDPHRPMVPWWGATWCDCCLKRKLGKWPVINLLMIEQYKTAWRKAVGIDPKDKVLWGGQELHDVSIFFCASLTGAASLLRWTFWFFSLSNTSRVDGFETHPCSLLSDRWRQRTTVLAASDMGWLELLSEKSNGNAVLLGEVTVSRISVTTVTQLLRVLVSNQLSLRIRSSSYDVRDSQTRCYSSFQFFPNHATWRAQAAPPCHCSELGSSCLLPLPSPRPMWQTWPSQRPGNMVLEHVQNMMLELQIHDTWSMWPNASQLFGGTYQGLPVLTYTYFCTYVCHCVYV